MGMSTPSEKSPISDISFFDETLNASQKDAVKFALESPEVACIHGPPGTYIYIYIFKSSEHPAPQCLLSIGTGKTHTLIEIIRQLTTPSQFNPKPLRLLVCGASNLSVDNILERLLALPAPQTGEKLKVTRIGHPARVMAQEEIIHATLEVKAGRSEQVGFWISVNCPYRSALIKHLSWRMMQRQA